MNEYRTYMPTARTPPLRVCCVLKLIGIGGDGNVVVKVKVDGGGNGNGDKGGALSGGHPSHISSKQGVAVDGGEEVGGGDGKGGEP